MDIKSKSILILGFGITGVSSARALSKMGAEIFVLDDNIEEILKKNPEYGEIKFKVLENIDHIQSNQFEFCIKSPGIHPENKYIKRIKEKNIEIISDLELAYRLYGNRRIVAITGTNGKTTTTSLVGEIFKTTGIKTHVIGNIGVGILNAFESGGEDDIYIIECSSFQLHDIRYFRAGTATIINITEDHLDWHGSMESYINDKLKIFDNSLKSDISIINYDDLILKNQIKNINGDIKLISRYEEVDNGVFIRGDSIIIRDNVEKVLMNRSQIKLPGEHNLENILIAIAIGYYSGVDESTILNCVKNFNGVEHRIEFVRKIHGVKYYNDSKGTNVDATVNAIRSFESGIVLIAGGYDKGVEFDELFEVFDNRVKALVLLGQTKDKIIKTAKSHEFRNIFIADDMREAVKISHDISMDGDTVLLSPACASWGMYDNFEERGKDFKRWVQKLGE
ncbi:MAG: UDP-N-acetylmuramoyl-L-alanine--D-glutamate ligase [Tissierellia bacterium]|nr:UDP-N-acetylmuramoyl-L-alanine--D-glutamate ligase [Tissierellia bacterium]